MINKVSLTLQYSFTCNKTVCAKLKHLNVLFKDNLVYFCMINDFGPALAHLSTFNLGPEANPIEKRRTRVK